MVKNKVCKKLYLASAIAALAIAVPAYSAEYDIKEYSTGPDSLINHTPVINETDTLNIRKNLTADQNLPSYPSITINGNSHILDGIGTFNGFTTESDKTLTINNYLIKNTPTSLTNSGTTTLNAQKGITELAGTIINEGILNLNSDTNGYLQAENITSDGTSGTININSSSTAGVVKISGTIANQNVNLSSGTLKLGEFSPNGAAGTIFSDSSLNLSGGSLDVANGAIDTIAVSNLSATNSTNILFDTNLADGTSDNFTVTAPVSGSGNLKITGCHFQVHIHVTHVRKVDASVYHIRVFAS